MENLQIIGILKAQSLAAGVDSGVRRLISEVVENDC